MIKLKINQFDQLFKFFQIFCKNSGGGGHYEIFIKRPTEIKKFEYSTKEKNFKLIFFDDFLNLRIIC
jgi:hypothetical protein